MAVVRAHVLRATSCLLTSPWIRARFSPCLHDPADPLSLSLKLIPLGSFSLSPLSPPFALPKATDHPSPCR